jgi:hypothetical protein
LAWKVDFEQTHANSFTMQKLNLINPIRRKYQLQVSAIDKEAAPNTVNPAAPPAKPLMKPRPK